MNIEVEGFVIRHSEGYKRFDLYAKKVFGSGVRKGQEVERPYAYGITFPRAIEYIIHEIAEEDNERLDLKSFITSYEAISERILKRLEKLEEIQKNILEDSKPSDEDNA